MLAILAFLVIIVSLFTFSFFITDAFADTVFVQNAVGSSVPGCHETNSCFIPSLITIEEGDTVIWTNPDSESHTVTSGTGGEPDNAFDSSIFKSGTTFSVDFNFAGTYPYFCQIHPWMTGVVVVEESSPSFISLDSFPSSARIGDVITFSGNIQLGKRNPEGAVIYIKDEDPFNRDDLLVTAWADSNGRFSANWMVTKVDFDWEADVYATFDGNEELNRLTTCGKRCANTIPLKILPYVPPSIPPVDERLVGQEYMVLYYSRDFSTTPKVAIIPSPDSYNEVSRHIVSVQEGIRMWKSNLESEYGGNWDVDFEIVSPGTIFFKTKPDVVVNLVTHDEDVSCVSEYSGWSNVWDSPSPTIQTQVCVTSLKELRTTDEVIRTSAHEFIHAMGLGHTFNKKGDMMCSTENGVPTCSGTITKSNNPSKLNLAATTKLYGSDGFKNPNNRVSYEEKFIVDDYQNFDFSYIPPTTPTTPTTPPISIKPSITITPTSKTTGPLTLSLFSDGKNHGRSFTIEEGKPFQFAGKLTDSKGNPVRSTSVYINDKYDSSFQQRTTTDRSGNFLYYIVSEHNSKNLANDRSQWNFLATSQIGSKIVTSEIAMLTVVSAKTELPNWIKNNAEWWSSGKIDDKDFAGGIEYMIKEEIIRIPQVQTEKEMGTFSVGKIPDWIKNNAKWWSEGKISDDDFSKGIEYMVKEGIIRI